jgi:hypothetical protein
MKVKELIHLLQQENSEAEVVLYDLQEGWYALNRAPQRGHFFFPTPQRGYFQHPSEDLLKGCFLFDGCPANEQVVQALAKGQVPYPGVVLNRRVHNSFGDEEPFSEK